MCRLLIDATSPVYLSTLEDGKIVRGLEGIPSEGPVLYVGYHMLLGLELGPMVIQFLKERNIHLRGLAHPMLFLNGKDALADTQMFDKYKIMGGVPVSNFNIFKLLRSKSHVLLYPGGVREALHNKVVFFFSWILLPFHVLSGDYMVGDLHVEREGLCRVKNTSCSGRSNQSL